MAEEEKEIWVICASCGHEKRKHRVLYEKRIETYEDEPPTPPAGYVHHRLVECMGCETIKYAISNSDWELHDLPPWEQIETDFKVYPDAPGSNQQRIALISQDEASDNDGTLLIPVSVWKM